MFTVKSTNSAGLILAALLTYGLIGVSVDNLRHYAYIDETAFGKTIQLLLQPGTNRAQQGVAEHVFAARRSRASDALKIPLLPVSLPVPSLVLIGVGLFYYKSECAIGITFAYLVILPCGYSRALD